MNPAVASLPAAASAASCGESDFAGARTLRAVETALARAEVSSGEAIEPAGVALSSCAPPRRREVPAEAARRAVEGPPATAMSVRESREIGRRRGYGGVEVHRRERSREGCGEGEEVEARTVRGHLDLLDELEQ